MGWEEIKRSQQLLFYNGLTVGLSIASEHALLQRNGILKTVNVTLNWKMFAQIKT